MNSLSQIAKQEAFENVGPIRHCEPPHADCPQRRQRQRQRVTEGTAMAP